MSQNTQKNAIYKLKTTKKYPPQKHQKTPPKQRPNQPTIKQQQTLKSSVSSWPDGTMGSHKGRE